MKKVYSLLLCAALCFSFIVMPVSADNSAVGVSINGWNGFSGDGITALNPTDSTDDVVKLNGEETVLTLDEAVSGNSLVSVQLYANELQDAKITALADDGTVMGEFSLSADGKACGDAAYETGKWIDAKILVFPYGGIYRTYLGEEYLFEGSIAKLSKSVASIKFTAGKTLYINDITVSGYTSVVPTDDQLKEIYKSDFSGTEVGTVVSSIDGWRCSATDSTMKYSVAADPAGGSDKVIKMSRTALNSSATNRFAKGVSLGNAVLEAKMYLPSKLEDGTDNNKNVVLFFRTDNKLNPNIVQINNRSTTGSDGAVGNRNGSFIAPKNEWFRIKLIINMDAQTVDFYLNENKVSSTPIMLINGDTKCTKINEIDFDIDRNALGNTGLAYIKDITISERDTVKQAATIDKTTFYEQYFDKLIPDTSVADFTYAANGTTPKHLTFTTVSATTAHQTGTGNAGMLYQPAYRTGAAYRITDDGVADSNAVPESSNRPEWFYRNLTNLPENIDNITLSFKYYDAKNAVKNAQDTNTTRDMLFIGFATGTNKTAQLREAKTDALSLHIQKGSTTVRLYKADSSSTGTEIACDSTRTVPAENKKWTDLSLTITKNGDNTATASVKSGNNEDTYQLASFPAINALSAQINHSYGGKFYLDDIEVYTAKYHEEILYTQSELMSITGAYTSPQYVNKITRNNISYYTIDAVGFNDGTTVIKDTNSVNSVKIRQWKSIGEDTATLYVASYAEDGRMIDAAEQDLEPSTFGEQRTVEIEPVSCKGAEFVKAFIWTGNLKPLAEPLFTGKNITVWIAGDSIATKYGKQNYPQTGWGMEMGELFSDSVTIENRAIGGRSSKSFILEGRLDEILANGKMGDYLLISFGHNDRSHYFSTNSTTYRYTNPTLDSNVEDPDPNADSNASYKNYLKKYIDGAREKGMIPVLITSIPMYIFNGDTVVDGSGNNALAPYVRAMKQLEIEENVPVIDLNAEMTAYLNTLGAEKAKDLYMIFNLDKYADDSQFDTEFYKTLDYYNASTNIYTDTTHLTNVGARKCAEIIVNGIEEHSLSLSNYIK